MGNFDVKFNNFMNELIANGAYRAVLEGLRNTVVIATVGLLIGIVIGTLIAAVRVMPPTNAPIRP